MKKQRSNASTHVHTKAANLVCGVDFSLFSKHVQFLLLSSTVLGLFILYGFAQEKIFHIPGFRSHGWYLTFIQFIFVTVISYMDSKFISRSAKRKDVVPPYYEFMVLSWMTVGTIGLSTVSLGFLNFPTQVIFKSCKLIPVMIGGIFILGKRYRLHEYVSVVLMCAGLIGFSLADQTVSPEFDSKGIILICMALCVDAAFGNYQEKLMKKYPSFTNAELVFYSYSFGTFLILTWLASTGQLVPSIQFSRQHSQVYPLALLYSTLGYLGVQCVLALIKSSGVLVCTIVTTMRKVLTVVLSFFFFSKPFCFQYVWSGGLVILGIGINVYTRNKPGIHMALGAASRSIRRFILSHQTPISEVERTVQQV